MSEQRIPDIFRLLHRQRCIDLQDIVQTDDGFFLAKCSIANILASKGILDFPDTAGERLACSKFYDDWYLYAITHGEYAVYSLLKFREQEFDAMDGSAADGDNPGVTVCFIAFDCEKLMSCLSDPCDGNRRSLDAEINRVVARKGQRHHIALKWYFFDPRSQGSFLIARQYVQYIASLAENGCLAVPEHYKMIVQQSISYKNAQKLARLPRFIDELNQRAGHIICDHENIYIGNREKPTADEAAAILATHTGNTSVFSFAAEVEYHAKYLTPLAKIRIPFFGRSIYDSAIRADMTICDTEFQGPAPFYKSDSKIVKRQIFLHPDGESFNFASIECL